MASEWFGQGVHAVLTTAANSYRWEAATSVKAALMLATYSTVSNKKNVHVYRSDSSASEATGQTVQTLASLTLSKATADSKVYFKATSTLVFSNVSSNQNLGCLVIFQDTGNAATSQLIHTLEFTSFSTNGQPITVTFNTNGVGSIAY